MRSLEPGLVLGVLGIAVGALWSAYRVGVLNGHVQGHVQGQCFEICRGEATICTVDGMVVCRDSEVVQWALRQTK